MQPSARAEILTRRTYCRPLDEIETVFEDWQGVIDRVCMHQTWLWERALGRELNDKEKNELKELRALMIVRKVLPAGRTLWLGGTAIAKKHEASQFNCSNTYAETVYDMVDLFWLLLQGCGTGFFAKVGNLNGFSTPIPELEIIRSKRTSKGGREKNVETYKDGVWTISIGDSAESWAKSIGKLVAGKYPGCKKLILDFSEVRPAGLRLSGYGWISSGDELMSIAYSKMVQILNKKAGCLLSQLDIQDHVNLLGTVLASRRSAQISQYSHGATGWKEFATCKKDYWKNPDTAHRSQSNNSLIFYHQPSRPELEEIFDLMVDAGGSEPGFINAQSSTMRAPWWAGTNPCGEILLANKGFCNLCEVDIAKFKNDPAGLLRALWLIARANYRQTLVNLKDGVLSKSWHQNNEFLRLCGVSLTGIVRRPDLTAYDLRQMRYAAVMGANSMAQELGLQTPKNTTCGKPSGTLSKIMDTTEGIHKPLGKYIFNNVVFGKHDPLIEILERAGYMVMDHPYDTSGVIISFPVSWEDVEFQKAGDYYVNLEPAVDQLERYKFYMTHWCDQNMSCTIYYDVTEIPEILDWLMLNWDHYVGVSWSFRTDPLKTAKDVGHAYLPQELVTQEKFYEYSERLRKVELVKDTGKALLSEECEGGACPVR